MKILPTICKLKKKKTDAKKHHFNYPHATSKRMIHP